jgi:tetratricopeptide (TPR) repeat protein
LAAHPAWVNGVAYFAGGQKVATLGSDGVVNVWDTVAQKKLNVFAPRGYVFLLAGPRGPHPRAAVQSLGAIQKNGGMLRLQIVRDGVVLRERFLRVPSGPLTFRARRDGDQLQFQINTDNEPLVYHDEFPLPGDEVGVFGLLWPTSVRLEWLKGWGKVRPTRPSQLEQAEAFYVRGQYELARDVYMAERRSGESSPEVRCKLALCEVALGRTEEAISLFRQLVEEKDDRWSVVASCQVALLHLRKKRLPEAQQELTALGQQPREELAKYVSAELRRQLLTLYHPIVDTPAIFKPDPNRVPTLERAVVDADRLNVPAETAGALKVLLIEAYHAEASPRHVQPDLDQAPAMESGHREKLQAACARAEEYLREPTAGFWLKLGLLREIAWLRLRLGTPDQGIALINSYLLDDAGEPRAEYLPLLVERARLKAALGAEKESLADLNTLFLRAPPDDGWFIEASLLRGFLLDNPKDNPAARAAWELGRLRARDNGTLGTLCGSMLAGLSGPVTPADAKAIRETVLSRMDHNSFYVPFLDGLLSKEKQQDILSRMWQKPRSRAYARAMALRQVSFGEYYRLQLLAAVTEGCRQLALPDAKYDDLLWQIATEIYNSFVDDRLTFEQCLYLAGMMVGQKYLWGGVKEPIGKIPGARARIAFLLGHCYLRRDDPASASSFFQTAVDDATDDVLRNLARQQLNQLTTP